MDKCYLMALNVGGGSGRCLIVDIDSGDIYTSRRSLTHPVSPDTNVLGRDLDFDDIWRKLGEASREALRNAEAGPAQVLGIAPTGMRFATVVLDAERNIILGTPNTDARAAKEAAELGMEEGKAIHDITGHWPCPVFTGSRLLWLKANAPEILKDAHKVMGLSDWIEFRPGGGIFAEKSQAGESMLFDQREGCWADELIASLGLEKDIFPEIIEADTAIGVLSEEAGAHLGLIPGIPIAAGGADTRCGLLGAGAVQDGQIGVIAGTTLPIQLVTGRLILDQGCRPWSSRHVVPELYVLESNGLTTGSVLEWFSSILFFEYDSPLAVLFSEAERSEPGARGVYSSYGASIFDARSINLPVGDLTMSHMITSGDTAAAGTSAAP